eukprot:SM000051S17572  [mRNA]  locus=s51:414570:421017:- [translate_table: standard]
MDGPAMAETAAAFARWHPPPGAASGGGGGGGLRVSNSLCNEKVPFVASSGGRQVTWYICGPTVYDSSHVGHARTYLAFDIIRRILEDYFGYQIFYVMNVTDVDDKIIHRARRNHLLNEYLANNIDPKQVQVDVQQALKAGLVKQEEKVIRRTQETAAAAAAARQKEELATQVAQEELKLHQLQEKISGLEEKLARAQDTLSVADLIALGGDSLCGELDAQRGAQVTDHSIYRKHAARCEEDFFKDMAALGVRPPDVLTRVTEYIEPIINYVAKIVERGLAYESNQSVYFDTLAFRNAGHVYGKLCPWAVGSAALASESEADFETTEKRSPNDFALWKASKPGEPSWESPWGRGRPGWHIECSAMASDILGQSMDIHSGGMDLRFPHHDNELAQAEAFFDCNQWVNYFLHTGHLHIEGLKMSKSLKNFITIQQALEKYTARQIRLLFVLQSWDMPMNFGESTIAEALSKEKQLKNFFQNVEVALREAGEQGEERWAAEEKELHNQLLLSQVEVHRRLEDNFDTSRAMLSLSELCTAVNVYISQKSAVRQRVRPLLLRKAASHVNRILAVFGLVEATDELAFSRGTGAGAPGGGSLLASQVGPYLDAFLAFRDQVRAAAREGASKEAMLGLTDKVRDYTLVDLGVRLEDRTNAPSIWKLDNADTLRQERDEKQRLIASEALKKLENKRTVKVKELEKWDAAALPPGDFFLRDKDKFSTFDSSGIPTHDSAGKELSGKARKVVFNIPKDFQNPSAAEKDAKKAQDGHDKFLQKQANEPGFLETLRAEVHMLTDEITRLSS